MCARGANLSDVPLQYHHLQTCSSVSQENNTNVSGRSPGRELGGAKVFPHAHMISLAECDEKYKLSPAGTRKYRN